MLEVTHRDGRARCADWTVGTAKLRSPHLIWPETSLAPVPAWAEAVVTETPTGRKDIVEIGAGGTWFYPTKTEAPLVVAPPRPAPSTEVQLLRIGDELAVFHDAGGWASNPKTMVPAFIRARTEATPGRLLWAPALGTPQDYALWTYLGVDLFDASPLLRAASQGVALTTDGEFRGDARKALGTGPWDFATLVKSNAEAARLELDLIRHHIATGTLRALVERRIYGRAAAVEILRRFDREHTFLEQAAPHQRAAALPCMTAESLWMPEVESFRRRFREQYQPPPAPILVLMPCSARKPYKLSRSHRHYQRKLDETGIRPRVHEVMITSPLGLVPRELEEVYPAQKYDIPVTGHWTKDEEVIVREQLRSLIQKGAYQHVVCHLGPGTFDVLRDLLPEGTPNTVQKHPTAFEDLDRLSATVRALKPTLRPAGGDRWLEDLRALATFQFGRAVADDLVAGAHPAGRPPYLKLMGPEGQRGATSVERGAFSLTAAGAAILAKHNTHRVFLKDFQLKSTSSLFSIGVEKADPDIRVGDEVAILQGGQVVGCGVAQMPAEEMGVAKRGVAVSVRHIAPRKVEVAA